MLKFLLVSLFTCATLYFSSHFQHSVAQKQLVRAGSMAIASATERINFLRRSAEASPIRTRPFSSSTTIECHCQNPQDYVKSLAGVAERLENRLPSFSTTASSNSTATYLSIISIFDPCITYLFSSFFFFFIQIAAFVVEKKTRAARFSSCSSDLLA